MSVLSNPLNRLVTVCNKVCLKISMVLLFFMLGIVTLNVILRYVFGYSITWTEESARFMMVWITFMLLPYAQQKGQLVAVDFLVLRFRYTRFGVVLAVVMELITLMILFFCIRESYQFVLRAQSTVSMALQLPMWMVSLVMPYSFFMTFLASFLWLEKLLPCLVDPLRLKNADAVRGEDTVAEHS